MAPGRCRTHCYWVSAHLRPLRFARACGSLRLQSMRLQIATAGNCLGNEFCYRFRLEKNYYVAPENKDALHERGIPVCLFACDSDRLLLDCARGRTARGGTVALLRLAVVLRVVAPGARRSLVDLDCSQLSVRRADSAGAPDR